VESARGVKEMKKIFFGPSVKKILLAFQFQSTASVGFRKSFGTRSRICRAMFFRLHPLPTFLTLNSCPIHFDVSVNNLNQN